MAGGSDAARREMEREVESLRREMGDESQTDYDAAGAPGNGADEDDEELRMLTQQQIHDIFDFYCNFGRSAVQSYQDTMDSFMFMKFARECPGLLDRTHLSRTDIDLIFTKAKPKFERRLDFEHFLDALSAVAEKKYPDFEPTDGLRLLISQHLAPHFDIVQDEMAKTGEDQVPLQGIFRRLYDPRNYTGVYRERFRTGDGRINGESDNRAGKSFRGSTNQRSNQTIHDISSVMRPNLRGGTFMSNHNHSSFRLKKSGSMRRSGSPAARSSRSMRRSGSASRSSRSLSRSRKRSGVAAGGSSLGGSSLARPRTAASPARPGAAAAAALRENPSIDPQAETAKLLAALEEAKSGRPDELMSLMAQLQSKVEQIQQAGEAAAAGTDAPAARPATAGAGADPGVGASADSDAQELQQLEEEIEMLRQRLEGLDPAGAEAREVRRDIKERRARYGALLDRAEEEEAEGGAGGLGSFTSPDDPAVQELLSQPPPLTQEQILEIFEFYSNFGRSAAQSAQDTMDSFMFMKFARECPGLVDDDLITRTDIDLIFTKAKPKGERRLTFSHFLDALSAISERKYSEFEPADGLRLLIHCHLAPHYDAVQAEVGKTGEDQVPLQGIFRRLYDPRNYTGVYRERFRSGDGRINGESDNRAGKSFRGSTNQKTDEVIHDISSVMRPNLRGGTMMRTRSSARGGSIKSFRKQGSPARGPSFSQPTASSRRRAAGGSASQSGSGTGGNWY